MKQLTPVARAVAGGALALALSAGVGVASADPSLDPIVNTTCSYPQVMAAANAQDPATAAQFNSSPTSQSYLRQFLAASPSERRQMAEAIAGANQQYVGLMQQIFSNCNNF